MPSDKIVDNSRKKIEEMQFREPECFECTTVNAAKNFYQEKILKNLISQSKADNNKYKNTVLVVL